MQCISISISVVAVVVVADVDVVTMTTRARLCVQWFWWWLITRGELFLSITANLNYLKHLLTACYSLPSIFTFVSITSLY